MREQHGSTTNAPPIRTRQPVAYDYDQDEPRTNGTSTRRYVDTSTPRTVVRFTTHQEPIRRASRMANRTPQATRQRHWLFYTGVVLFLMLLGWVLLSVIGNWWNGVQDDMHYGHPRTAQYDQDVGHGGISHFTVENLGGHILVVEIPGNPSQSKIYVGPTLAGTNAASYPATLSFEDVNGDGLVDMVLTVDGVKYVFLNSKTGFHAQQGS